MGEKRTYKTKTIAYVFSSIALLLAILVYSTTKSMGFPDGHLTELERALKPLCIGYGVFGLLFGITFYGIASIRSTQNNNKLFYVLLITYIIVNIGVLALYFFYVSTLNHGTGA